MPGFVVPVAIALALYLALAGALFIFQRSFLYFPDRSAPVLSEAELPGLLEVRTESEPGLTLAHWYLPPADPEGPVVVIWHGNAGHRGHRVHKFRALAAEGLGLFFAEYRGYGGNPGSPTEAGLTRDAEAVMGFLAAQGIPGERIILYGESLGSGVAVKMARAHKTAGLVLEAPYTSIAEVAQAHYWFLPARWLVSDKWDSARRIGGLTAPLLILHGARDETIPVRFGRRLFEQAPEPKELLIRPTARHNDLLADGEVVDAIIAFVQAAADARGAAGQSAAD